MKISIAGIGYVGLSNAILLSQNHEVVALDIIPEKIKQLNNKISPIVDAEIEDIDQKQEVSLPRYNIAPTEKVYSLINDGKCYRLGTLKWGFNSSFNNAPLINARSETIDSKIHFK